MPGKGWAALRDRVVRSSLYASVDKVYFSEWSKGHVVHLPEDQRSEHAVALRAGKVWRDGRPLNPLSNFVTSSDTWFDPLQRFAYVLSFDASHKMTLYVHRHEIRLLHHSTTFAARPVIDAGMMSIVNGRIVYIEHKSGHYKPDFSRVLATLMFLQRGGIDLKTIFVSPHVPSLMVFSLRVMKHYLNRVLENGLVDVYVAENVVNARDLNSIPVVPVNSDQFFCDLTKITCN
ncbi:hypothetical protein N5D52_21645 [Pseudomonas sp. GD03860]|uniref:hypothetical protein n=1 Tax=Pseudomonas TaxID=286 RepID=UPI002363F444|nr:MULTISPECIES: hypothetical protein [Pseudomonas]MDD2058594.1 hypothetical protein [Pseudomonas putida]MDH0639541.1 hypothetical protein [Pseudomonas sp. GD03860]